MYTGSGGQRHQLTEGTAPETRRTAKPMKLRAACANDSHHTSVLARSLWPREVERGRERSREVERGRERLREGRERSREVEREGGGEGYASLCLSLHMFVCLCIVCLGMSCIRVLCTSPCSHWHVPPHRRLLVLRPNVTPARQTWQIAAEQRSSAWVTK